MFNQSNPTGSGGFGSSNPTFGGANSGGPNFGNTPSGQGMFGSGSAQTAAFGTGAGFGGANTTGTGGFGSANPAFGGSTNPGSTFGTGSGFGSSNNPAFGNAGNRPMFGEVTSSTTMFCSGSAPMFGTATTTTGAPAFGSLTSGTPAFGQGGQTPAFGTMATTTNSALGSSGSTAFGIANTAASNLFGNVATTTSSMFGTASSSNPAFGATANTGTTFGTSATAQPPTFGKTATTTASSMFGNTASTGFNAATPRFGSPITTSSASSSVFGTSAATFGNTPAFGGTSSTTSSSVFGAVTSATGMFSSTPAFGAGTTSTSIFGSTNTATSSSIFGSTTTANTPFGVTTTAANIFGSTATSQSPMSTSVTTSNSVFGSITSTGQQGLPITFGGKSNTGSSAFQTTTSASEVSQQPSTGTGGIVGSKTTESSNFFPSSTSSNIFGAKGFGSSEAVASVFGKVSDSTNSEQENKGTEKSSKAPVVNLFKKLVEESVERPTKETSSLAGLFGKPAKEAERGTTKSDKTSKVLFGKQVPDRGRSPSPTPGSSNSPERRPLVRGRVGLFTGTHAETSDTTTKDWKKSVEGSEGAEVGSKIMRRRSTLEDINKKVAIVIKSVDRSCNNKDFLRKFFQKFGVVKRVFTNPAKESATIHFEDHYAAEEAMRSSRYLKAGTQRIQIFWSSHTPKKEPGITSGKTTEKNELDDELASMQGTSDLNEENVQILERPGDLNRESRLRSDQPSRWKGQARAIPASRARDHKGVSTSLKSRLAKRTATAADSMPAAAVKPEKGASHITLKSLTNALGRTVPDKLEILDNRDKIFRMARGSTKQADLATAEAIIGTCPDMCPEKERYLREERRRLGVYEIIPGTENVPGQNPKCDHFRTVKEYSRSSADQDMPLPNELRPPPVLSMTMDYLMNNIMDLGTDGKWGEWYEYLWSRTRSLRKDITQQHLCDLTTVAVIEKNCRFHIYCGERLCEEDMADFDQQINDENLTKCLQTLKEMYYDLEKKGVKCPNEEEFRSYIILMNLNEGDTLREVQQLRVEIRESQAVKFATNVYSALNRNNYIKFFKLVRMAPFLYACLLHRYFNQVRSCALRTMLKAYRWPGQSPQYPLSELNRLLGFETNAKSAMFCRHHGLSVDDDKVLIDRTDFIEPEAALEAWRAKILIESKQAVSIGEVVNGGPLPPNVINQPHSSFDANDRFIATEIQLAEPVKPKDDVDTPQTVVPPGQYTEDVQPQTVALHSVPSGEQHSQVVPGPSEVNREASQPSFSSEAIKDVAKEMFLEIINEQALAISQAMMRGINIFLGSATQIYEDIETCAVDEAVRQISRDTLDECRRDQAEKEARQRAELSARKAEISASVVNSIIQSTVIQECQDLAEEQYNAVREQLMTESENRVSEELANQLLDRAVQEETCLVAEHVFETDVVDRLEKINEAHKATQLLVMARFMKKWKNQYAARQRLKRSILTFPPAPSLKHKEQQVYDLIPESEGISRNSLHLGMGAYATLDSTSQTVEKDARLNYNMTLYKYWRQRRREKAWAPLNLGEVLYKKLLQNFNGFDRKFTGGSIYWKLVLSLPDVGPNSSMDDEYAHRTINCCDWLKSKFTKGTVPNSPADSKTEILSLYTTPVHLAHNTHGKLGLCVRVIKGFPDEDEEEGEEMGLKRGDLLGTSAVMFYVGEAGPDHGEYYIGEVQSRLQHILENLHKSTPIPLVVLCPQGSLITQHDLNLEAFVEEEMISGYRFISLCKDIEDEDVNKDLYNSILWSTSKCPVPPRLCSSTLRDMVENTLAKEYFTPVYENLNKLRHLGRLHQPPELLITYYNHLISHMAHIVCHSSLQDVSWPVAEFSTEENLPAHDWNTPDQLSYLQETVMSLELPGYERPQDSDMVWESVLDHVWAYIVAVAEDGENNVAFYSKVKWLLRKVEGEFEATCHTCLRLDDCQPEYDNIPWTDLIHACIEYKLGQTNWQDLASEDDSAELMTHYVQTKLDRYRPPVDWRDAVLDVKQTDVSVLKHTLIRSAKRKMTDTISTARSPPKAAKLDKSASFIDLSKTSQITMDAIDSAHSLNNLLAKERKSNEQFEEFLQKSLLDDSLNESFNQTFGSPQVHASVTRMSFNSLHTGLQPLLSPVNISRSEKPHNSVSEEINHLNVTLNSHKQADKLFEMRLKSFLID